jgi:SHS2 domain-containing protein
MEICGYREISHAADLALNAWADSPENLIIQAAKGFYELAGVHFQEGDTLNYQFEVEAEDLEGLLVSFLNELLFLLEEKRIGFRHILLAINNHHLTARLIGSKVKGEIREIKAATYHNLKILKLGDKYEATIIFDV